MAVTLSTATPMSPTPMMSPFSGQSSAVAGEPRHMTTAAFVSRAVTTPVSSVLSKASGA